MKKEYEVVIEEGQRWKERRKELKDLPPPPISELRAAGWAAPDDTVRRVWAWAGWSRRSWRAHLAYGPRSSRPISTTASGACVLSITRRAAALRTLLGEKVV